MLPLNETAPSPCFAGERTFTKNFHQKAYSKITVMLQSGEHKRGSLHSRDAELRTILDAGRPTRGNRLGLGVEAD